MPQEDIEADQDAASGHSDDTARNAAEDIADATEGQGNEV
jgi:hypothetical protein